MVEEGKGVCYVLVGEFFAFVAYEDNINCVIFQRKTYGLEEDVCVGEAGFAELKSVLVFDYEECARHCFASLSNFLMKLVVVVTLFSPWIFFIFKYVSYQL